MRMTFKERQKREVESGSLDLAVPTRLVGFVSELSAVTSGAAGLESIFPWGRGMGFGPPHTLCPFLTEALLAPLPMSGVSCGLVLKRMHQVIWMMFQKREGAHSHLFSSSLHAPSHGPPVLFFWTFLGYPSSRITPSS